MRPPVETIVAFALTIQSMFLIALVWRSIRVFHKLRDLEERLDSHSEELARLHREENKQSSPRSMWD
jgi:hypothetical protein